MGAPFILLHETGMNNTWKTKSILLDFAWSSLGNRCYHIVLTMNFQILEHGGYRKYKTGGNFKNL